MIVELWLRPGLTPTNALISWSFYCPPPPLQVRELRHIAGKVVGLVFKPVCPRACILILYIVFLLKFIPNSQRYVFSQPVCLGCVITWCWFGDTYYTYLWPFLPTALTPTPAVGQLGCCTWGMNSTLIRAGVGLKICSYMLYIKSRGWWNPWVRCCWLFAMTLSRLHELLTKLGHSVFDMSSRLWNEIRDGRMIILRV